MEVFQELYQIKEAVWSELIKASHQKKHAWRTPIMGNLSDDRTRLRTIVLRKSNINGRSLRFYTDRRSAKWPAVKDAAIFSLLFWDPRKSWQVHAQGNPKILDAQTTDQIWSGLPVYSRSSYATLEAPGDNLLAAADGLPESFFDRKKADTEYARPNFGVFELVIDYFEFLQLSRNGHRRAKFSWHEKDWKGEWVVP
ncbi:MAG: hypothetical protein AAGF87_00905 [Bacteroidota bacterium]